ncbi:MAG: FAD-dependent oxidoreductase [Bacteroidaceae bacterium]|nr:FAD-dependent oxidoreductase [Bacteroidaceae bacterium]
MSTVAIIGAGVAGIEAAHVLASNGIKVKLFEKGASALKNIQDKAFLFPNFQSAQEIVTELSAKLLSDNIETFYETEIINLGNSQNSWVLTDKSGHEYVAQAVLVSTGYKVFDASRKEELGYGIYKGVITSLDMENMIRYDKIVNAVNSQPRNIVFLQCVGSRDEKVGNHYCSKLCCVTAVKQAIEVKKRLPQCQVSVFYMDLRMWGQGFEEMYRQAQEQYKINFVRGRISESASTFDGRLQIKSEDTLLGLPLKMTADLLVLMVGMEPSTGTTDLGKKCNICGEYGFIESLNPHIADNKTAIEGLYVAGTAKRPMTVQDCINDGRSAAVTIQDSLRTKNQSSNAD